MAKKKLQTDNSLMILAVISIVAIVVLVTTSMEMTTSAGERGKKIVKESVWDQFVKNMEPPAIDDPRGEGAGARGYGGGGLLGGTCPACETVILNGKKVTRCHPPTDEEIAERGGGPGGRGNGPEQLCGCFCDTSSVWDNDGNWYPGLGCLHGTIPLEGMTGAWGNHWWTSNYKYDFYGTDYYCDFFCGDGEAKPGSKTSKEECDKGLSLDPSEGITPGATDLRGYDCTDFSNYDGGSLDCSSNCQFDTSGCTTPPEQGGCTDTGACNYESWADYNDGSCTYAQGSCNCNGNPTGSYCDCNYNYDDDCGVCDGDGSSCECPWYDCAGVCEGNAVEDECGVCNGDGSSCADPTSYACQGTYPGETDINGVESGCWMWYGGTWWIQGCHVCPGGDSWVWNHQNELPGYTYDGGGRCACGQ